MTLREKRKEQRKVALLEKNRRPGDIHRGEQPLERETLQAEENERQKAALLEKNRRFEEKHNVQRLFISNGDKHREISSERETEESRPTDWPAEKGVRSEIGERRPKREKEARGGGQVKSPKKTRGFHKGPVHNNGKKQRNRKFEHGGPRD